MNLKPLLLLPLASLAVASIAQDGWMQHGKNAQHTSSTGIMMKPLTRKLWTTKVDLAPQYSGTSLLIHYMSPLVSEKNTVVIAVKTTASGGFRVQGRAGNTGQVLWNLPSTWIMPPAAWAPMMSVVLFPNPEDPTKTSAAFANAGGKIYIRDDVDSTTSTGRTLVFYGMKNYKIDPATYDAHVRINTPITADSRGNLFFGYQTVGNTPLGLQSGLARVGSNGVSIYRSAKLLAKDNNVGKMATNCAVALKRSEGSLFAVTNGGQPYMVALDALTLQTKARRALIDPVNGNPASVYDLGTASPMIYPNGDVYYGVLENPLGMNHYRGWLLRFDSNLNPVGVPGAFGWDYTPSLVEAKSVPSYTGTSPYLLVAKYNHYASTGGKGENKLAILDPNASQVEPVTGINVMKEVLTILGPTHDRDFPNIPEAVREWCLNTIAVDNKGKCALVSNEDGITYRWDFVTNTLVQGMKLNDGIGQAYTPTVIGPTGNGYAISNGILYCLGS